MSKVTHETSGTLPLTRELARRKYLIGVIEENLLGALSTPRLETAAANTDSAVGHLSSTPPGNRTFAVAARIMGWLFFVGGLVGAGLGIAGLHVEITVAGLILACTAGLILLKLRTDREVRETT